MKVIVPVAVTDDNLSLSSVDETDYAAWSAVVTYAKGDRVLRTGTHLVFESAVSGNLNNDPVDAASGKWLEVGANNRWAMFDQAVGSLTQAIGEIEVELDPGAIDSLAVLDTDAATVRVQVIVSAEVVYDEIQTGDGTAEAPTSILFLGLPEPDSVVVTISAAEIDEPVSVGTLIVGTLADLGKTETGATIGINDYSRRTTDDFGVTTVVERSWAKRMSVRSLIQTDTVDAVQRLLASLRARPCLWIGEEGYDALVIYGFFKDFSVDVALPTISYCTLTIEGLTTAAELSAAAGQGLIPAGSYDPDTTYSSLQTVQYQGASWYYIGALPSAGNAPPTLPVKENDYWRLLQQSGPEIVGALPGTDLYEGRVVYLNTNGKLYRYHSGAWTAAVASADISGTLLDAQIASLAASKVTGQLTDAQLAAIAAAKITGQLATGQLADASISLAKFATGLQPVTLVTSVPGTLSTRVIFNTTDGKQYRWDGSAYVAAIAASDISGTLGDAQIAALAASKITGQLSDSQLAAIAAAKITGQLASGQIADAAISIAKFASGIQPVTIVSSVPGTLSTRVIFNTTDGKQYRWDGSAYVATVPAADISGTLADAQIAALAASKLTGQITSTQITDGSISSPKIAAGAVIAGKIAAGAIVAADIAAGTITGDRIAGNTITAANIAADTITAGQIAAGAINASELAAGAVVAGKIAAGAIVAADIAADTITASQIAANAITATELAAGAVVAGKIAAGTIQAADIAAGSITGDRLAANTITASQIAADTITAGQIAAGAINSSELAAGAVVAGKIAAGAIVAADIAADTITASQIAASAITSTELAAGAVVAGKIAAGTIQAADIAAATITGDRLAANTITASQIAADTITATQIAANAIGTSEIAADAVTAAKIDVSQLSAITATIGTLRTATSGARTEIKDNLIEVYNSSNVLIVRIGQW